MSDFYSDRVQRHSATLSVWSIRRLDETHCYRGNAGDTWDIVRAQQNTIKCNRHLVSFQNFEAKMILSKLKSNSRSDLLKAVKTCEVRLRI